MPGTESGRLALRTAVVTGFVLCGVTVTVVPKAPSPLAFAAVTLNLYWWPGISSPTVDVVVVAAVGWRMKWVCPPVTSCCHTR